MNFFLPKYTYSRGLRSIVFLYVFPQWSRPCPRPRRWVQPWRQEQQRGSVSGVWPLVTWQPSPLTHTNLWLILRVREQRHTLISSRGQSQLKCICFYFTIHTFFLFKSTSWLDLFGKLNWPPTLSPWGMTMIWDTISIFVSYCYLVVKCLLHV